jgi:3-oxoadipate enol-lactonase
MPMNSKILSEKYAEVNSNLLCFTDMGEKNAPVIVFIHDLGLSQIMWEQQMDFLKKEYRVVSFDVRGHGKSGIADGFYNMDLFAEDLIGLLNYLNIPRATLCGVSMGGFIALRTTELFPERINGLILCETKSYADSNEEKTIRYKHINLIKSSGVSAFAAELINSYFSQKALTKKNATVSALLKVIESTTDTALFGTLLAMASRVDCSESLKRIMVPTLIIAAEKDDTSLPLDAQYLNHFITGSTLKTIKSAAHLINIEQPEEFNDIVKEFLNKKIRSLRVNEVNVLSTK